MESIVNFFTLRFLAMAQFYHAKIGHPRISRYRKIPLIGRIAIGLLIVAVIKMTARGQKKLA
jgi:hypothetical protein